jgi:hypothetical protein
VPIADESRRPLSSDAVQTPQGGELFRDFIHGIAGCGGD